MIETSIRTLEQFKNVLNSLPKGAYVHSCNLLSGASIGQHTRHIIELYQCLINGYVNDVVCYDNRQRNKRIEEDLPYALEQISDIQNRLDQDNKPIRLLQEFGNTEMSIPSNYFREVMYNLEHTIHHKALIKVGIRQQCDMELPESFGVAPSTIAYKTTCVQ